MGAGLPDIDADARGFGWNLSPSLPDEEEHPNQIPTLQDLQASHRRILATKRTLAAAQRTLATAVKQHGVLIAKCLWFSSVLFQVAIVSRNLWLYTPSFLKDVLQ
ncbi:uncharacterized protein LOC142295511 isoform X4 [Anomaloglossus baeobatrachus]|uniref:uncharacterized protein LOC142295511 isoform X4 n=1 Tax=Anomaloglossus baeobatrachus TaxID=238106 RepID=UPI003F4FF87D